MRFGIGQQCRRDRADVFVRRRGIEPVAEGERQHPELRD